MAADLLGERPQETGECDVVDSMTYDDIQKRGVGSDFLIELENYLVLHWVVSDVLPIDPESFDPRLEHLGMGWRASGRACGLERYWRHAR